MVNKKGKGGKGKRKGKNSAGLYKRELISADAEQDQVYAEMLDRLGGPRMRVRCADGVERMGIVPGKLRKREWMNKGDILLVQLRGGDFTDDDKCDILRRYLPEEVRKLRARNEIPQELGARAQEDAFAGDLFEFRDDADADADDADERERSDEETPQQDARDFDLEELDIDDL